LAILRRRYFVVCNPEYAARRPSDEDAQLRYFSEIPAAQNELFLNHIPKKLR
jgi:hypothetical protein